MTISIRHALNADTIPLQHIIKDCFSQYAHSGVIFDLSELPDLINPASSLPPRASLFVASLNHRIVGSLCIEIKLNNSCEIKRFYVHPRFQGQKIGQTLLNAILPPLSHLTLFLWTDTRFTKAHTLYAKLGFKNDNTSPRIIDDLSKSKEIYFVALPHTLSLPHQN